IVLNRLQKDHRPWREIFNVEMPKSAPRTMLRLNWQPTTTFVISCCIVLAMCGYRSFAPEFVERVPQRASFAEFPFQLDGWKGMRAAMEQEYLNDLKLDDYVVANFSSAFSPPVNLYVAWYNSQRGGQSSHSPRTCLPGAGWRITSLQRIDIPQAHSGGALTVNRVLIENSGQRQLMYYWFQQRGRIITNEYMVKWYLFQDALFKHRTDGALVRLIVALPEGISIENADASLASFTRTLARRLSPYIPD
ncbi:MAG: exosortase C-terminal domain/associated protein EpsI, partial [Steroidobacter sp.]